MNIGSSAGAISRFKFTFILSLSFFFLPAAGSEKIVLKALRRAMNEAVTIAEMLKSLHQVNCLTSSEVVDIFEPLEEGLDVVESKRCVSCMTITISTTEQGVDKNDIGYQVCN